MIHALHYTNVAQQPSQKEHTGPAELVDSVGSKLLHQQIKCNNR